MKKVIIKRNLFVLLICITFGLLLIWGCSDVSEPEEEETPTREESIPADAIKMTPELDI